MKQKSPYVQGLTHVAVQPVNVTSLLRRTNRRYARTETICQTPLRRGTRPRGADCRSTSGVGAHLGARLDFPDCAGPMASDPAGAW
jgi:hypothetical protein